MIRSASILFACAAAAAAQAPIALAPIQLQPVATPVPHPATPGRAIDLVICLDVSGSMEGLINAARQNLWAVVNEMATLEPQPDLRVALLTFGCPAYGEETGFVAVQTGLTNDLDLVSQKLFALSTNGGDEFVARVTRRALDDLQWSKDPQALKMIFVAGNEAATQDPKLDPLQVAADAIQRGILVNTIFCGAPTHGDADGWRQVALRADGSFATIEKDAQEVILTPFDEQLTALSAKLNTTYLAFGADRGVWTANQVAQDSNAESLNPAAAAQRCQTKAMAVYFNGNWDLVDALKDEKFELAKLKPEDLPEELRKLDPQQLRAHIEQKAKERAAIQAEVQAIGTQRDAFVLQERARRAAAGEKMFDAVVIDAVRQQAESRGFQRKPASAAAPAATPAAEPVPDSVDPQFEQVVKDAVEGYQQFVRVTGELRQAPELCRAPPTLVRESKAERGHGGKLYLLYARLADGLQYVTPGEPAKVGQTLVKEAWQRVDGAATGPTEASRRYPLGLQVEGAAGPCHAGDAMGLFVMHKLAPDTAGTDQGWVYGTVDRDGKVTGAGRMASCIRCHEGADNDRRFGLDAH